MFRFTIRERVLVTMVMALGVAWWVNRSHSNRIEDQLRVLRHFARMRGFDIQELTPGGPWAVVNTPTESQTDNRKAGPEPGVVPPYSPAEGTKVRDGFTLDAF